VVLRLKYSAAVDGFTRAPRRSRSTPVQAVRVRTRAGACVDAGAVVVATNASFHERFVLHTKQAAYRTFVIIAIGSPG